MAKYTSKRKALYIKVMLSLFVFFGLVLMYLLFLMKAQVIITFTTNPYIKSIPQREVNKDEEIGQGLYNLFNTFVDKHERPGYTFERWIYESAEDSGILSPGSKFEKATTLTAVWKAKSYTLSYDFGQEDMDDIFIDTNAPDAGSIPSGAITVEFDEEFLIPSTDAIVKNRIIVGEDSYYASKLVGYQNKKTGEVFYASEAVLLDNIEMIYVDPNITEDMTIYGEIVLVPVWEVNKTSVLIDLMLPDVNPFELEVNVGSVFADIKPEILAYISDNNITNPGHSIGGYYREEQLTNPVADDRVIVGDSLQVYVYWAEKTYDIIFDSNGGAPIDAVAGVSYTDLTASDRIIEPEPPQRSGYEFTGWYTSIAGGEQVSLINSETGEFVTVAELLGAITGFDDTADSLTLYAHWVEEEEFTQQEYDYYADGFYNFTQKIDTESGQPIGLIASARIPHGKPYLNNTKYGNYMLVPKEAEYQGTSFPVIEINMGTFSNLTTVEMIYIPETVTQINDRAFINDLSALKIIKVSTKNNSFKDIDGVLYNYEGTKLIKYPAGRVDTEYLVGQEGRRVEVINDYAFTNAKNLTSVTLNVRSVGDYVFDNAEKLASVIFEEPVETLGDAVFRNTAVVNINTVNNTNFNFVSGVLYNSSYTKLVWFTDKNVRSYEIDSRVEEVGAFAFSRAESLEEVSLNNVSRIGVRAFALLGALNKVNISSPILESSIGGETALEESFYNTHVTKVQIVSNITINKEVLAKIFSKTTSLPKTLTVSSANTAADNYYAENSGWLAGNSITIERI